MNILHATLGFYPATAWGGPTTIVHQNGRELTRRGHRVTVYCTNLLDKRHKLQPGTFEREIDGLRVVYFNTWHLPWWPGTLGPFWTPDMPRYLTREMRTFDVVHINGYRGFMYLTIAAAARRFSVPFVVQPHGTMPIIVNSHLVKRFYDLVLGSRELEGISALIALQQSERQQALDHGIAPELIEIIPNGLDLSQRPVLPMPGSFRERFNLPADKPLVLFLGRINKKKGTDMLVHAFAQLDSLDARLAIVGPDDGQLDEVKGLIRSYGLERRIVLPGLLSGSDVYEAYQDADLFVLPCRVDTFPTTILEACLVGTPMVVTEGCEIAHLVRDRIGEVTPFDPTAFAQAMWRLLTDRDLHARYKANCPSLMREQFSLTASVDRIMRLYERVTA